jgi:hypothetical protein
MPFRELFEEKTIHSDSSAVRAPLRLVSHFQNEENSIQRSYSLGELDSNYYTSQDIYNELEANHVSIS